MVCKKTTSTRAVARTAVAIALLQAHQGAHMMASACSTFTVNPWSSDSPGGPNTVSGRTVDFSANMDFYSTINLVPVPLADDGHYTANHGFLATVANLYEGHAFAPVLRSNLITPVAKAKSFLSAAIDGLNDAGLSCAALYDRSIYEGLWKFPGDHYPEVNASDKQRTQIIGVYSMCKYILANFDSAEGAMRALDPSKTQIVQPKLFAKHLPQYMFPVHFIVTDKDRQMWVAEFGMKDNGDTFAWRNATEWGVVTNAPQLPTQLANLKKFINRNPEVKEAVENVARYQAEGITNGTLPAILNPVPGSMRSRDRFVRLALFNRIGSYAAMLPRAPRTCPRPRSQRLPRTRSS